MNKMINAYLSGRCTSGIGRNKPVIHYIESENDLYSLCGKTYGKRSAGWYKTNEMVTCQKCKKLFNNN